jgi:hypothetical protein
MSSISTLSEVRRFRFIGSDALYLNPLGHRVIADFEGHGDYRVESAEASLLILRDEKETDAFRGSFANSLSVLALSPGEVEISVMRDMFPLEGPLWVGEDYEGAGWVASAEGPLWVDGRLEHAPVPFFRNARASRLHVSPSPFRSVRVDRWRIGDAAGLKARGWKVQNVSKVVSLESAFDDGTPYVAPVACHLNAASWRCAIPADNHGLRLRKTYDRFHGRQRARVFIDGEFAGWWYEPLENRTIRWGIAEFGIPVELTAGKEAVQITIDPPAGSPLWSVSEFEVDALVTLE